MADPAIMAAAVAQAASGEWTIRELMYAGGVGVAVISASIASYSAWLAVRRDLNSLGDSEIKLYELISKSVFEFSKFQIELREKTEQEGEKFKISKADSTLLDLHIETVLNAYDIACQRYVDGKLDEDRFASTYQSVIRKLYENPLYQPVLAKRTLQYSALNRVNSLLNDPENTIRKKRWFNRR